MRSSGSPAAVAAQQLEQPPPQFQLGERDRSPVDLRWESPKSTIQLEDLLFGIGSQFDDMTFSPRQLSYMKNPVRANNNNDNNNPSSTRLPRGTKKACSPVETTSTKATKEMALLGGYQENDAFVSEETVILLDKGGEDPSGLPLLYEEELPNDTAAGRSKPGSSYLRHLPETLAPAMRRVLAVVWNLVRWKVYSGICVRSSLQRHHQRQKQQGGEKLQGVRGLVYI
ncbi:hypothetical protein PG994_007361 [Apiospora phragmitis]|uniref:Uncharacterized protein n=1 Tax=Apiospora phragmitis TaxID=2905665 RepID=A0ABR1V0K1_9PEZI